jgi:hypothetical protein
MKERPYSILPLIKKFFGMTQDQGKKAVLRRPVILQVVQIAVAISVRKSERLG